MMNNEQWQRHLAFVRKRIKKLNDDGYALSTYYSEYGYDYDLAINIKDVYIYIYNEYSRTLAESIKKRCEKNIHILNRVVNILDEYDKESWVETKRDIYRERGALNVD